MGRGRHEYYSLAGKSDVTIEIDDDKKVVETNENNNVAAGILRQTCDAYWSAIPYTCTDGIAVP